MVSTLRNSLLEVEMLRKTVSDLQCIVKNLTSNVNGPETKLEDPCMVGKSPVFSAINQHTLEGFLKSPDLQRCSEPVKSPKTLKPNNENFTDSGMVNSSKTFADTNPQFHSQSASSDLLEEEVDWKIPKYAGDDEGVGLCEFLETIHQYAESEQISLEEYYLGGDQLFTGKALAWYQTMMSQNRLFNWYHLVCELKMYFNHPEPDAVLTTKAYQRLQQKDESFQDYYLHMEKLFDAMSTPITRSEQCKILKRNLRAEYKKALDFQPVNTMADLICLGKAIDASMVPIYQKVSGNFKETSPTAKPATDGYKPTKPQQEIRRNHSKTKIFWNRTGRPPSPEISKPKGQPVTQNLPENAHKTQKPSQTHKPVPIMDYLVEVYRPPDLDVCYNCEERGHRHEMCPFPLRVFCVICGFEGFEHSQCPYCLKQGIRTD